MGSLSTTFPKFHLLFPEQSKIGDERANELSFLACSPCAPNTWWSPGRPGPRAVSSLGFGSPRTRPKGSLGHAPARTNWARLDPHHPGRGGAPLPEESVPVLAGGTHTSQDAAS